MAPHSGTHFFLFANITLVDAPRSSIAELEGLASARVDGWEETLARARSGAPFRNLIGRGTIRKNYDESLRNKVRDVMWRSRDGAC